MHRNLIQLMFVAVTLLLPGCASSPPSPTFETSASAPGADEAIRLAELIARGDALGREKRYKEALDLFRAAEKIRPSDLRVLYGIGTTLRHMGNYRESLNYFARLLELAPDDPRRLAVYGQIGIIHRNIGNYAAAIKAFGSLLTIRPDDHRALAYLGDLYFQTKQYDLSKQYIELFRQSVDSQNAALFTDEERREIRDARSRLDAYMRAIEQGQVSR